MFRRVDSDIPLDAYRENPNYKEACALYDKSIALQKAGDPGGSTQAYLAALEAQAKLRSIPLPVGPEVKALPLDLYCLIFRKLPIKDLLRAAQVSRGWRRLTRDPRVWRAVYLERWPNFFALENIIAESDVKDWYVAYKKHHIACRDFPVVVIDIGHANIKAVNCKTNASISVTSIISQYSGHYWSAGEGLQNMVIGSSSDYNRSIAPISIFAPVSTRANRDRYWPDPATIQLYERMRVAIMWTIQVGLHGGTRLSPLLLARCPSWSAQLADDLRHELCFTRKAASDYIPFYASVYSPVLVAFAHQKRNAVVVSMGDTVVSVCYVWDGEFVASSYIELSNTPAKANDVCANVQNISNAIKQCITKAAAKQSELWKTIIITGGRATGDMQAALRKAMLDQQTDVLRSTAPERDVINGGLAMGNLSTIRDLFTPIRQLKSYDTNKTMLFLSGYSEYSCPVAISVAAYRKELEKNSVLALNYDSLSELEMCFEQHKELLLKCKRTIAVFTILSSEWTDKEYSPVMLAYFQRLVCKDYARHFVFVIYHPQKQDISYAVHQYTARDFPASIHFVTKQTEVFTFLEPYVGKIPITVRRP